MAKRMAEEFTKRQEQAAAEAAVKKRIRLNQIKDAARRREAEEHSTKIQQLRSAELAEQRKKEVWDSEQKRRRDEEARIRQLRQMTDAKAQREEFEKNRHASQSCVTRGSSECSTDSYSNLVPRPPKRDRLVRASNPFHPVPNEGTVFSAPSSSYSAPRSVSPFWSDDLSLGSLDSSQFEVPPTTKKGNHGRENVFR